MRFKQFLLVVELLVHEDRQTENNQVQAAAD